ncbi:hypothetical protein Goari_015320 [Gossypium aridum]|uniref:Uncharacterized protein n=1 Tax=Gossypium aridum TaxID=34290 RepID=A0A7J8XKL3_GOSAI|nr:hypothetical protein [Gossypium aridum]
MDVRTRPPLRRKSGRGSNSSSNEAAATLTGIQPRDENNGGALVHTITRFLHELKSNPTSSTDPNRSST